MYSPIISALKYLGYWLQSSNGRGHGVHSPFVFEFIQKVLNDRKTYQDYRVIEQLREQLLSDRTPVPFEDYGAGSKRKDFEASRSVAAIASASAKSAKYAQLLYRMSGFYQPQYILELGTSLGISTAYLASGSRNSLTVSGEGNYVVASMASRHFHSLGLSNIRVVTGNFDNTLPEMVASLPYIDLAFLDGNHREIPTLNYYQQLLPKMSSSSMIIIDDIHWSAEMESVWLKIKNHSATMLSVDLFFMGIIFFRPGFKEKQDFTIRF